MLQERPCDARKEPAIPFRRSRLLRDLIALTKPPVVSLLLVTMLVPVLVAPG